METSNKLKVLNIIADSASECVNCDLHKNRDKSVFHRGSLDAKIAFVGEAPGANENETGIPFVGRAGNLLDKMITAMGLEREDAYVCNVCKCRPPDNRKPESTEMDACKKYLDAQLSIVEPDVIVTLGATATEALLGSGPGITKRRGNPGKYQNINVIPTFHPSYLLRNPKAKMEVRDDLKQALNLINGETNES